MSQPPPATGRPTVVIVSFRRADLLRRCLTGVRAHLPDHRVILWDNRSEESAAIAELSAEFAQVQWHFSPQNVGFAAAVNGAAKLCDPDDLLLLNPDAELLSPLPELHRAANRAGTAAAAPLVVSAEPRIQTGEPPSHTGEPPWRGRADFDVAHRRPGLIRAVVSHAGYAERLRATPFSDLYPKRPSSVTGYLTGACLLITRAAWNELGPFDEEFFLYGEEAEWQRRATAAGWRLELVTEEGIRHAGHGTVSDSPTAARRSRDLLTSNIALQFEKAGQPRRGQAYLVAAAALDRLQRSKRGLAAGSSTAGSSANRPGVLITTNTLGFGGAERQRVLLANELAARGHPVTLLCLQRLGPLAREVAPTVRLLRRPWWAPWLPIGAGRGDRAAAVRVVISGTTNTEVGFAALWSLAGRRRRWLVAAHNPPRPESGTYSTPLARVIRSSSGVIALSERHWSELTARQRLNRRHFVAPNGVDRPAPKQLGRGATPPDGPVQLRFIGRMVAEKRADLLIGALDELRELPWQLTIYGDGPDLAQLRGRTPPDLIDSGRVVWGGWSAGADEGLAGADLLCVPSGAEAFPIVILEAMVRGVAVVASAVCSVPEILDDGRAGRLVEPGSVDAWREALRELLSDRQQLASLAGAAEQRASRLYSVVTMADNYQRIIAQVTEVTGVTG
ncbi:glycosyltransferase involved in cell wall bisynthesis [Jatrophihabitans sp. GAS493]|uniref:glycosyltransferase n=1 Tax=Jatrophihabitans sp. GAS493 TaxID=1907575 RepID=UPI000BB879A5|nr:glycosyltransferase [Jatrophihabitans sp. GAS493]SOD75195.1 glycosyltransferase involved in cell wall bisynthesis [Jatrophihabitans sp. GAS493]